MDWFRQKIANQFPVKFRARLGPAKDDDTSVIIMNRIVEWSNEGIRYEVDHMHAELIIEDMSLSSEANPVVTFGTAETEDKHEHLSKADVTKYRANWQ